jgi:hypothetical protein
MHTHGLGHRRATQIAVDDHDGPSARGQRQREVARDRGFSVAGEGARHHDRAGRVIDVHELQIGAQGPQRLGHGEAAALGRRGVSGEQSVLAAHVVGERDRPDHRELGARLDVLRVADATIRHGADERERDAEAQAQHPTHDQRRLQIGEDGFGRNGRLRGHDDLQRRGNPVDALVLVDRLTERDDPRLGEGCGVFRGLALRGHPEDGRVRRGLDRDPGCRH